MRHGDAKPYSLHDKITRAFVCPEDAHKTGEGKSTKGRLDIERLRGQEPWGIWLGGSWGVQGPRGGGMSSPLLAFLSGCVSGCWGDSSLSGA